MNFLKCTFSLISKEWRYHFCPSDWRSLYCVSDFPSHLLRNPDTRIHLPFYKLFLNSTALSQVLIFPFLNEGKKINPIFLWDDLCKRLIFSHSPSLHSFLHLRVTAPSSWMMYGTSLLVSPYFSVQTFWVSYKASSIFAFP